MKTYTLSKQQFVPYPIQQVFEFFGRAENLQELTPAFLRFQITRTPPRMEPGARIEYKLHVHGLPIHWKTIIEEWNPPYSFIDVQEKGPYRLWHHTHRFWEADGGTWIEDTVRYALPFGVLGQLAHSAMVKRDVEQIFAYRETKIRELYPSK